MNETQQMEQATRIARALTRAGTDPNEVASVVAALRDEPDGERFFRYLDTVIDDGAAVVRSRRTLDYYRSIRDACRAHLTPHQDDPQTMAEILGWAVRLMRYHQVEDRLEQPPPRVTAKPKATKKPEAPEEVEAGRQTGTVKWFNAGKGYGFIAPDAGGDDHFFHVSQLAGGLKAPDEGTRVSYVLGKGPKGRAQAQDVRPA